MHEEREVIIVEDDLSMRQALSRLLKIAGWPTRAFESAEALLASDAINHGLCFVLDNQLPGLSGIELARHLEERGNKLPVFLITAYDQASVRDEVARTRIAGYFPKPFAGRELLAAVTKAIAGSATF